MTNGKNTTTNLDNEILELTAEQLEGVSGGFIHPTPHPHPWPLPFPLPLPLPPIL